MKKKYAGPQVLSFTESQVSSASIANLEKAIQEQADQVRQLKASTKDKSVWQPDVMKLLDLKKQLMEAKSKQAASQPETMQNKTGSISVKELEAAIQAQGDKVRQLKTNTKDKADWQPEVNILLDLKKQLAKAQAVTPNTTAPSAVSVDANKVKELEEKVAKQSEKVRHLKASSDASVWKPEVETLLSLKKELTTLTGIPEPNAQGKTKKKK